MNTRSKTRINIDDLHRYAKPLFYAGLRVYTSSKPAWILTISDLYVQNVYTKKPENMTPLTLIEIIDACHLTKYLLNSPYPQRGGLMLVAPPAALKSTMIEMALSEYGNALSLTDLNVNTLVKLRDDLISNRYATIGFGEFEKLYQRHQTTASNIEGSLKALVEEGFMRASFEDVRMGGLRARVLIVGGMTPQFYSNHYDSWSKSGFARRFLWSLYAVDNPEMITEAIHIWKLLRIAKGFTRRYPGLEGIPFKIEPMESRYLGGLVKEQAGQSTPYVLLKKILSVLKWKYDKTKAIQIIKDFAPSLSKNGARLILPRETQ